DGVRAAAAARRAARAALPRDDHHRAAGGPDRGRRRRVRRRPRAGHVPGSAEGHHGAHAHARRVRCRHGATVHRLAVAVVADDRRRDRHRVGDGLLRDRVVPAGLVLVARRRGPPDRAADRSIQRGPHTDPLPPAATHSRGIPTSPGGALLMEKAASRLRVLALLIALMFIALTTRLWFLQVLAAQGFEKDAMENSVRLEYTD